MEKEKRKQIEKDSENVPGPSSSKQKEYVVEINQRTNPSATSDNIALLNAQLQSERRGSKKQKRQSVFRASVVAPELEVIPPLPRMSYNEEEVTEKLKRMINKLDLLFDDVRDENE